MKGCKFFMAALTLLALSKPSLADENLIAIDVLIEPDDKMLEESAAWNARMREQTPEGFELDETHRPHVTLLQRHIAESDLDAVLAAIDNVRQNFDLENLQMTAVGLYHIPTGDNGLAGITIEPTYELLALQKAVVDLVNPYDKGEADESAYVPDPTGTAFDPLLFEYVATFVPGQTAEKFNPHVTIGLAPKIWLEEIEAEPFDSFQFGAKGIAVYQLGNFGTAAKRLD